MNKCDVCGKNWKEAPSNPDAREWFNEQPDCECYKPAASPWRPMDGKAKHRGTFLWNFKKEGMAVFQSVNGWPDTGDLYGKPTHYADITPPKGV